MDRIISSALVISAVVLSASCQYDQGRGNYNQGPSGYGPKINILMHKQALSHDGSFNYAFSADNGLQQGEVINPDGSRQGSYSYVDPNGKTISLKYQAGKDGFKVLEGDHLPRAPPQPQPAAYQQPQQYHAPAPAPYRRPYNVEEDYEPSQQYRSSSYEPSQQYRSSGAYNEAEEAHTGPHSFGNGFSFEFGG